MNATKINFLESVKSDIIRRLEGIEGESMYLCDIGFELTMNENNTGSWYCSEFDAKNEIMENFELFGEAAEYMRDNFEDTTNPLLDTELFHVKAMIAIYESTFNAAVFDFDEWNEEIEIDDDFIERVREALESVNEIF